MHNKSLPEDVVGLYDCVGCICFLKGKSLKLRGRILQQITDQDLIFEHINKWARTKGYTTEGEVIGVYQ